MLYYNQKEKRKGDKKMIYIESIEELEYLTRKDERERPRNYKEHFYPCYISYEEPWDFHFCGSWYFEKFTPEETDKRRFEDLRRYRESLKKKSAEIQEEIYAINAQILALNKKIREQSAE
jgi:hypothetical protein